MMSLLSTLCIIASLAVGTLVGIMGAVVNEISEPAKARAVLLAGAAVIAATALGVAAGLAI